MRLISIRLHPFGGITDRTYSLHDGVQVLLGANEYGKSTFRAAVRHALFTPVDLTPAKQRDMMDRWFPIPGGKTAAITLMFIYKGSTYTLEKCWGEERISHLTDGSGKTVRGAREVQDWLDEMRTHSEGSYCRVFEVSQAQIMQTVDDLRSGGREQVNAAAAVMSGVTLATGDIELESLKQHLEKQIENACSRWDRSTGGPQRDPKTAQGGVERQWKNGVGDILRSWYAWQDALVQVNKRGRYDAVRSDMLIAQREIKELGPEIESRNTRWEQWGKREAAEREVHELQSSIDKMKQHISDWRDAEKNLASASERVPECDAQLQQLRAELTNALRVAMAATTSAQLKSIRDAETELANRQTALSKCVAVDANLLSSAREIIHQIRDCDLLMQAHQISAHLAAEQEITVEWSGGVESPRPLVLRPGQHHEVDANGRIVIAYHGLTITIRSSQATDEVLSRRQVAEAEGDELLRASNCQTLEQVVESANQYSAHARQVGDQEAVVKTLLQGRTREEWSREEHELSQLPSCRGQGDLESEIAKAEGARAGWVAAATASSKKLDELVKQWSSLDLLENQVLKESVTLELRIRERDLMPPLPDRAEVRESFREDLAELSERRRTAELRQSELEGELYALGDPGSDDLESLEEAAAVAEWKHQQALELVHAKLRIVGAINKIRGDTDPFAGLGSRVMELFHQLTAGKYSRLQLDTGIPSSIERADGAQLSMIQLSQGTGASLALAVRVALIESLLQRSPLFVVLDDPFVDLDADRRARAMEVVRQLGARTQVILLTCHPAHAEGISPVVVENAKAQSWKSYQSVSSSDLPP